MVMAAIGEQVYSSWTKRDKTKASHTDIKYPFNKYWSHALVNVAKEVDCDLSETYTFRKVWVKRAERDTLKSFFIEGAIKSMLCFLLIESFWCLIKEQSIWKL